MLRALKFGASKFNDFTRKSTCNLGDEDQLEMILYILKYDAMHYISLLFDIFPTTTYIRHTFPTKKSKESGPLAMYLTPFLLGSITQSYKPLF